VKTRLIHAVTLCLAALALAACATATLTRLAYSNAALAYNNIGPLLTWMVDDYVDLSDPQEDWVRDRVARQMEWHRTQELPKYRDFLESALAKTESAFGVQDVATYHRGVRAHYHRLVEHLIPDMAEFLANVDAEQIAQLERKFAEDNRKFARESVKGTPEERRARRMRRFTDHLEGWVGPLSDEQRDLVAAHYRGLPDFSDEMLGERRFRQAEIMQLVRTRPPRDAMVAQLRRLLVQTDDWRRPEYLQKVRARDQKAFEMLAALSATLSPAQRDALQKRIRAFMREITTLIAAN
jgi:hypothetical protein